MGPLELSLKVKEYEFYRYDTDLFLRNVNTV